MLLMNLNALLYSWTVAKACKLHFIFATLIIQTVDPSKMLHYLNPTHMSIFSMIELKFWSSLHFTIFYWKVFWLRMTDSSFTSIATESYSTKDLPTFHKMMWPIQSNQNENISDLSNVLYVRCDQFWILEFRVQIIFFNKK